jgi:hypothetical protein
MKDRNSEQYRNWVTQKQLQDLQLLQGRIIHIPPDSDLHRNCSVQIKGLVKALRGKKVSIPMSAHSTVDSELAGTCNLSQLFNPEDTPFF